MSAAVEKMIENPAYSLEWINAAKDLMDKHGWNEDEIFEICGTDAYKVEVLLDYQDYCVKTNTALPFEFIFKEGNPNATQMRLRFLGCCRNIPVEDMKEIGAAVVPSQSMNYLMQGIVDGFDMKPYIGFDHDQIAEIYSGMKSKIDYNKYANKNVPAEMMGIVRHALEMGLNAQIYTSGTDDLKFKVIVY